MTWKHPWIFSVAVVLAFGLFACGGDDNPVVPPGGGPEGLVSDFSLPDVNPNSGTYQASISPRDYQTKISAWYFGHAT